MPGILCLLRERGPEGGKSKNNIRDQGVDGQECSLRHLGPRYACDEESLVDEEEDCCVIRLAYGLFLLPFLFVPRIFHVPSSVLSLGNKQVNNVAPALRKLIMCM